MLVEKRDGIVPKLGRRPLTIAWPIVRKESVPGVFVNLDRDVFAGGRMIRHSKGATDSDEEQSYVDEQYPSHAYIAAFGMEYWFGTML